MTKENRIQLIGNRMSFGWIPEAAQAPSCGWTVIWGIGFILGFSMTVLQVSVIVSYWLSSPTVSEITTTKMTQYPPILYCPSDWIALDRANPELIRTGLSYISYYADALFSENVMDQVNMNSDSTSESNLAFAAQMSLVAPRNDNDRSVYKEMGRKRRAATNSDEEQDKCHPKFNQTKDDQSKSGQPAAGKPQDRNRRQISYPQVFESVQSPDNIKRLAKFLIDNQLDDLPAFYLFIARNFTTIDNCRGCQPGFPKPVVWLNVGVCYLYHFEHIGDAIHYQISDATATPLGSELDDMLGRRRSMIGFGPKMYEEEKSQEMINIAAGDLLATLLMEPTIKQLLSSKNQPCTDPHELHEGFRGPTGRTVCLNECNRESYNHPKDRGCNMIWKPGSSKPTQLNDLCQLNYTREAPFNPDRKRAFRKCVESCNRECLQWAFDVRPRSSRSAMLDHTLTFELAIKDPDLVVTILETRTYTWSKVISDIGGSVGIFLGASWFSFMQFPYLLYIYYCRRGGPV